MLLVDRKELLLWNLQSWALLPCVEGINGPGYLPLEGQY